MGLFSMDDDDRRLDPWPDDFSFFDKVLDALGLTSHSQISDIAEESFQEGYEKGVDDGVDFARQFMPGGEFH